MAGSMGRKVEQEFRAGKGTWPKRYRPSPVMKEPTTFAHHVPARERHQATGLGLGRCTRIRSLPVQMLSINAAGERGSITWPRYLECTLECTLVPESQKVLGTY